MQPMVAKLTVILFILVCLMVGSILVLLPWTNLGMPGDWTDNIFLDFLVHSTGVESFRSVMASGWVRGAVTGLGVFNLFLAFWEIANFNQSVAALEGREHRPEQ